MGKKSALHRSKPESTSEIEMEGSVRGQKIKEILNHSHSDGMENNAVHPKPLNLTHLKSRMKWKRRSVQPPLNPKRVWEKVIGEEAP